MKKLLALVLALVMTLGLATVGTSAAYSDAADVSLTEAVDVMSAVGVFQGSDGKFSPKENLTREQAAKLIAYLDLGENTAEALPAVKVFDDVEATRWSAKYIAYCKDAGYIAGVGNGKFNPTGELTGYAFGKMVLCALGYDADIEGFTGGSWSINVAKLMESNGITDGIDSAASLTLTREQAAQYCFNALQADMVWYDGVTAGTTVTTSDGTTVTANGSNGTRKVATTTNFGTLNGNGGAWNAFTTTANTLQLGEYLYNTKLMPSTVTDDFGRSATKWTYKTDDVVTYADEADKTYVVAKSGKSVATILTDSAYIGLKSDKILPAATLYINGFQVGTNYASFDTEVILELGDTVELFYDGNSRVANIVVRRYFASEIDKVSTSLGSTHTAQGATTSIKLKAAQNTNYSATATLYDAYKNDSDKVLNGFNANTYVEGAILAVAPEVTAYNLTTNAATYSNGTTAVILDSYVANTVEGKVTNFKSADYITLDGTKYTAGAGVNGTDITYSTNKITTLSFTNTYKLFLDANNYILGFDGTNSAVLDDVVYVDGLYVVKGNTGNLTYYAVTVGLDGVKKEIQIEAQDFVEQKYSSDVSAAHGEYTMGTAGGVVGTYYAFYDATTAAAAENSASTWTTNRANYYTLATGDFTSQASGTYSGTATYYKRLSGTGFAANSMYALNKLYSFKDASSTNGRSSNNGKFEMAAYTAADGFTYQYGGTTNSAITSSSLSVALTGMTTAGNTTTAATRLYFTDDTKFLAIKGTGDELSVKTATKLMTMDTSTNVITIYPDGKTDASYIIFYGANLTSSATSTKDVYYLASDASTSVGTNKYSVTLYPMDDPANPLEDVIIASGGTTTKNFVTVASTDSDGVRTLQTTGVASASDLNNSAANTGKYTLTITSSKNGYLSGNTLTNCTDIDYKNATIIDSRTDAQRELDKYAEKITSVETMEEALDEGNVVANVYFTNGKATFIAVQSAANKEYTVNAATLSGAPAGTTITTDITSGETGDTVTVTVVVPSSWAVASGDDVATLTATNAGTLTASSYSGGAGLTSVTPGGAAFTVATANTDTSTSALTLVYTAVITASSEGDAVSLTVTFG